ncbi:Glycerol-3-phosphate dehydrogenase 1 [Paraconexibacter sp. AEG42_29]|uniref:Glycerol-3-phosphate dehydrogenase n=1 Tax=Paraconexibacter sp. AEG42_29 TaxID=2997339 RepID=A0AAU7B087_9ACTN
MIRHTPGRGSATLNGDRRTRELEALAAGRAVDVLVVGGGITGVGVALDAATRGLSVALLERDDLASGTSRWSSKLAHGGLRYLAKGDVGVAWESAAERAILVDHTAPHLIRALPQVLALRDGVSPAVGAICEAGIRMGDGLRFAARTSGRRLPRARRISAAEALRWVPALDPHGLRGALLSWDGQLEDDARLVVALARTAAQHGARIITHAPVTALHADGADAVCALTGQAVRIRARHVVSATGVWAGELAAGVSLRPSKGSHLLFHAGRLGDPAAALNVPVPGHFGRFVFALPRPDGLVLVGLTDEPYDGPPTAAPAVEEHEERFLLETISAALDRPLAAEDVVGRFAGLRPLLDTSEADGDGATADVSRRHAVIEDPGTRALTIVGGKLTTYRRMAQDVVDRIAARPGVAAGPCLTHHLPVVGAQPPQHREPGVPAGLTRRYGADAPAVLALADGRPELLEPLAPGVPAIGAEVRWAIEQEGALTAEDVLDRRTRIGLIPAWRAAAEPAVRALLAEAGLPVDPPPTAPVRSPDATGPAAWAPARSSGTLR